jgi:hypothetical protein
MNCPRCGALVQPGRPCLACAPLASIEGKIKRRRFIGNPMGRWTAFGWWVGMALGGLLGVGVAAWEFLQPGWPGPNPVWAKIGIVVAGAAIGAMLGAALVVLYKSLVRPILLALFSSELFEREYGTLDDRRRPPGRG